MEKWSIQQPLRRRHGQSPHIPASSGAFGRGPRPYHDDSDGSRGVHHTLPCVFEGSRGENQHPTLFSRSKEVKRWFFTSLAKKNAECLQVAAIQAEWLTAAECYFVRVHALPRNVVGTQRSSSAARAWPSTCLVAWPGWSQGGGAGAVRPAALLYRGGAHTAQRHRRPASRQQVCAEVERTRGAFGLVGLAWHWSRALFVSMPCWNAS